MFFKGVSRRDRITFKELRILISKRSHCVVNSCHRVWNTFSHFREMLHFQLTSSQG